SVFGVELAVRSLFDAPTPAGLVRHLDAAGAARTPLRPADRTGALPLSFAQHRLWFLDQMEGPSPTYNIPLALRLAGPVDAGALRAALRDVVVRHEVLRTVFPESDGVAVQRVLAPETVSPELTVRTVTEAGLDAALADAARHAFDLSGELPLRADLFVLGEQRHVLLLTLHHIAGDGWSLGPLGRDL
ncbi:condensation domain-containing protein, partial [Streptomyces griseoviridis]